MASGETTAVGLVRDHVARIEALDSSGPQVNAIIEVNPDAESIAAALDRERAEGHVRGPLHGIPIVLKDCFATADRMETTAGSLALVGSRYPRDAGVVAFLRQAGAVILGKANMSEWNAYRGWPLHGGWSGRAGIGLNPYALNFSTGDSSSGSAAAVAASFAAGAIGLETYGSIVMPSALCGVVGLKPTTTLVSRSGSIPISFTRDAIGPIGRSVADVAAMLGGMVGVDPLDPATAESEGHVHADYTRFLDPDGLRGARIGIWRRHDLWNKPGAEEVVEELIPVLRRLGATVVDPVELPDWGDATGAHGSVMAIELRWGIERYLAELTGTDIRTLGDVVAFNQAHWKQELRWHNQALLKGAVDDLPLDHPTYLHELRRSRRLGREAFADPIRRHRLDAIFCPTFRRAWMINLLDGDDPFNGNGAAGPSNAAGYPHITLPGGFLDGLPVGVSFLARAWEEPKLLRFAFALEQALQVRRAPRFLVDHGVRAFVER
jgi:amidase